MSSDPARDYVSRLWAEDWDSPEDAVYDDYRPDLLADADEPARRQFTQRWTPATGWRDVNAEPADFDQAAAASWRHSQTCGAHHPCAGFYCTDNPGHADQAGHTAADEFGKVLRRWSARTAGQQLADDQDGVCFPVDDFDESEADRFARHIKESTT